MMKKSGKSPALPSVAGKVKQEQRSNEPSHFEKQYKQDVAKLKSQKIKN